MATLILSAVGEAIAGPIGSLVGAVVGSQIDQMIFAPGGGAARREGPRLGDLSVQSATYGAPVSLAYGRTRMAGNVIWSSGLIETQHSETTSSGGKGGSSVTTVSYTYSASFAVALSGRPILRVDRIWADGKLIRNAGGPLSVGGAIRVYGGDENQMPDPLIEARQGAGQVPAHRGLAYVLFDDLQLAEFANRIPNLTIEVVAEDGGVGLATIVADLAGRVFPSARYSTQGLSGAVTGYMLRQPIAMRDAIEPLGQFLPFQAVERAGRLAFEDLPQQLTATVLEDDLGAGDGDASAARLEILRRQDWELPREMAVYYLDRDRDFQPNVQRARTQARQGLKVATRELPIALAADQAKTAAECALSRLWTGRDRIDIRLPLKYLAYEPGDWLRFSQNGRAHHLLVQEQVLEAGVLRLSGARFDPADLSGAAEADGGEPVAQQARIQGPTHFELLDLPCLAGAPLNEAYYYAVAAGTDAYWRRAGLFRSEDGGASYAQTGLLDSPGVIGAAAAVLPDHSPYVWDRRSALEVELLHDGMALASRPALALLNGGNSALVGAEIIQFETAQQLSPTRYRLTGLLRGRLGTEAAIAGHQAGERFVLLANAQLRRLAATLGEIGQTALFKASGPTESLSALSAQNFTYGAANLRPLSPAHFRAVRASNGDLHFSWIRRSRQGFAWIDGADAPLAEESERYEVDILAGGQARRVLESAAPGAVYSLAAQNADFGGPAAGLELRIYQMSALVGRGAPLIAAL